MDVPVTKMKKKAITLVMLAMIIGSVTAGDISDVLSPIQGQYEIVWAYNASDTADPWKKYVPGAPDWANDLEAMNPGQGYWIKMLYSSSSLTVDGLPLASSQISLATGWNLIGYPSTESQSISSALSGIAGKYEIVWAYNSSDTGDPWKRYMPGGVGNDLDEMRPGCGYWIKMTQSATLTI